MHTPIRSSPLPSIGRTLLGLVLPCAIAAAGSIYQTDFEAAEGYSAGTSLLGQNGWSGLSPISIEAAGVAADPLNQPELGQFGYIGGYRIPVPGIGGSGEAETKQIVTRNIAYTPGVDGGNVVTVSMDLVPFYDNPISFDQFGIALVNSYQEPLCTVALSTFGAGIVVIDQLDEAGAEAAEGVNYVSGNRYELRFELNFAANTWNAWFGGNVVAANRRLSTAGMQADLGSIAFTWGRYLLLDDASANHYLIFDRLRFSADPLPSLDASVSMTPVSGTLDLDLSVRATPGMAIILQYSPSLNGGWTDLQSFTVPAGGMVTYRHLGVRTSPRGFYRIATVPDG